VNSGLERLQAAQQEPGRIGRGDDPGPRAELEQAVGRLALPADHDPEQHVRVPTEKLRRTVEDEIGAVLERP
jgi:hypothetical protein